MNYFQLLAYDRQHQALAWRAWKKWDLLLLWQGRDDFITAQYLQFILLNPNDMRHKGLLNRFEMKQNKVEG